MTSPLTRMRALTFIGVVAFCSSTRAQDAYDAVDENGVRLFSKVPPVGIHPRVIMSPEDIPAWRERVGKTYRGKTFFAKPYRSPRVIDVLAGLDPELSPQTLCKAYPEVGPGTNHELLYAAMDVMYHQDAERTKKTCRAIANFARVVMARRDHEPAWGKIEKNIGGIDGNTGIRTGLGELWCRGGADFALAYDFLYNEMSPSQRDVCRRALSVATKDLICWGMNFPRGRGISNWYGYHGELGPMLLAIEGEEGFHEQQWHSFRQMIRDWAEVHFYESGGSNEDGYSINTSLREGQFTLIAMARRGENYYARPHFHNYFKWAVLSLVPGEDSGDTVGYSSSRVAPYESAPVVARWAMPGDKLVNFYLRRYKGKDYQLQNRWQYANWSTLLCMNYEDSEALPLEMGKLGLPITHVFPMQGLFITRSDWSDDAAYLNVLARHDAWYDRHENVDRGRFVFAADGRRWVIDRPWGTAQRSDDHSLVHIDGVGQVEAKVSGARGKAPNANLIKQGDSDDGLLSQAVVDLSNAYNWLWAHSWDKPGEGWEPETRSFDEIGWPWKRPGQPEALFGHDDRAVPKYNFMGCNLWRKSHNPVARALRTAALVRGEHPYAVIIDDFAKDGEEHQYTWMLPLPLDVDVVSQSGQSVVLGEQLEDDSLAQRRLLIRFCGNQPVTDVKLERYELTKDRRTGEPIMAQRLVATINDVAAEFRVVLFPHHDGETLPKIAATGNGISVSYPRTSDRLTYVRSGREQGLTLIRSK